MKRKRPKNNYDPQDRLFHKAKEEGLRSRAGFKLQEIQEKYKILQKGQVVMDLGAAPGAWSQVAAKMIGPQGKVFALDTQPLGNPESLAKNIYFLKGDITQTKTHSNLETLLNQENVGKVHVVLSDLSPKLSGIGFRDHLQSLELAEMAFTLAQKFLYPQGHLLIKIFPGEELDSFRKKIKKVFLQEKLLQLDSSRRTSREVYLWGNGFKKN